MMAEHRIIDIPCSEETLSISTSASGGRTGSTYGLLEGINNGGGGGVGDHRIRIVQKYTARCKMLGALLVVVLVIGGSAMYIGSTHNVEEVIRIKDSTGVGTREKGPLKKELNNDVFLIRSKVDEAQISHLSALPQPQARTHNPVDKIKDKAAEVANHSVSDPNIMHKQEHSESLDSSTTSRTSVLEDSEDDMQGDEPDRVFNLAAKCGNHVKRDPRTSVSEKMKSLFEGNPVGLLDAMRECPTFIYYECKFHDKNKPDHGFKVFAHVRSINNTFTGFGARKKEGRKNAAYRATLTLYPTEIQHTAFELPEMSARFEHAHCIKMETKKT